MEFLSTFLYCARRWFAAHIIIISDRPSVRLNTSHAHAMYVTIVPLSAAL